MLTALHLRLLGHFFSCLSSAHCLLRSRSMAVDMYFTRFSRSTPLVSCDFCDESRIVILELDFDYYAYLNGDSPCACRLWRGGPYHVRPRDYKASNVKGESGVLMCRRCVVP